MPRFAVVARDTLLGPVYYVAPGEMVLEHDEQSVFVSSKLEDCVLTKAKIECAEEHRCGECQVYKGAV